MLLELLHSTGDYRWNVTLRKTADQVGEEVDGAGEWEERRMTLLWSGDGLSDLRSTCTGTCSNVWCKS